MDENERQDEARTAEAVISALVEAGETVAVAESLTGGLLAAALVAVPGASRAFRGGVVAYAGDVKERLLGVDPELLAANGAVDPTVAVQMAMGARWRLDGTWGLATTGVAGPDPQPGDGGEAAVGTVYLGIAGPRIGQAVRLHLPGSRTEIREESARQALRLLATALGVTGSGETADDGSPNGDGRLLDLAPDGNNAAAPRVPHM